MARPTTKSELIAAANTQIEKMQSLISTMPGDCKAADFAYDYENIGKEAHWKRDKNVRDILVHLYEWHQLLLSWVEANIKGNTMPFLPEPYTWKTYGEMNVVFWEKHQSTPYEKSHEMLRDSHKKVIALIESFSDEELFEKKHFSWTGTTNLGSYCISATSSHYDWAVKKLKAAIKAYGAK